MRLYFKTFLLFPVVLFFLLFSELLFAQGKLVYDTIYSKALEGNLLGDSPKKEMTIYLPPGYENSTKRYPVIYFIHGYLTRLRNRVWFIPMFHADAIFDSLIMMEKVKPFIAVMPDGDNKYEGSWYVSNPVSGDFERYIVYEIPKFIESRYRVIPGKKGRALTGHSMGGYGTAYLGTKYAQEYTAICIMSGSENLYPRPRGRMADSNIIEVPSSIEELLKYPHWKKGIYSRAAAYSPNPSKPPFYVDLPVYRKNGVIISNPEVWKRYVQYSPLHMVPNYLSNLQSLKGIAITVGADEPAVRSNDEYHAVLQEYDVRHEYHVIFGTHLSVMPESIRTAVRFFSQLLEHE